MLRLALLVLLVTPAAADSFEVQASAHAALGIGEGFPLGPGVSVQASGAGRWAFGVRGSLAWQLQRTQMHDIDTRTIRVHLLAQHQIDELTLTFGLGVDQLHIREDGEPYADHTIFFGGSVGIAYAIWRDGPHAIEVDTQLTISPLFDILSFSGEYTSPTTAFTASAGLGYRARL